MPPRRPQGYLGGFSAFLGSPHPVFWVVPIGRVRGQPLADPCQYTIDTFGHAAALRVRVETVYQPMRIPKLTSRPPAAIHRANMRFHATANHSVRRRPNSAAMWATWYLMVPEKRTVPTMTTRALAVVRLSVLSDCSTSPVRQLEDCTILIRSRGWEHVGTAEDLDVSATKYSPFNRPELGQWLTDDPPEPWDVLVVWRLDRLIRSSRDLAELLAWCEDRGKGFVSATEGFDL